MKKGKKMTKESMMKMKKTKLSKAADKAFNSKYSK